MTPECQTTEMTGFREIVETTFAISSVSTSAARGKGVYDRMREILRYDVRSIGEPSQAWFWTQGWQERENQAEDDIASGRTTVFGSGDDLLAHIDGPESD